MPLRNAYGRQEDYKKKIIGEGVGLFKIKFVPLHPEIEIIED